VRKGSRRGITADPLCEIVARKVIEIDAAGTHEPKEVAKMAVKELGIP